MLDDSAYSTGPDASGTQKVSPPAQKSSSSLTANMDHLGVGSIQGDSQHPSSSISVSAKNNNLAPTTSRPNSTATSTPNISHYYPPAPMYPRVTPTLHSSPIQILSTPSQGRGVYSTEFIPAGTLIEISPVLLLNDEEYYGGGKEGEGKGVEGSVLRSYVFTWRGVEGGMAVALGLGSMFNHSESPNVSFELNTKSYTIEYKTFKSIEAETELCIFYGHKTSFTSGTSETTALTISEEDSAWGGLNNVELEEDEVEKVLTPKERRKRDEEILLWEDLSWKKVTSIVKPEDIQLTTFDCWVIDIPARYVQIANEFIRQHSPPRDSNTPSITHHLKRTRQLESPPDSSSSSSALTTRSAETLLSLLLFPVSTAPPDLPTLLSDSPMSVLSLTPYLQPVPSQIARTRHQADTWGKVWPVQMFRVGEETRVGGEGLGWERARSEWAKTEGMKVWESAREAKKRGELPVACRLTDSYDPIYHSSLASPVMISTAVDTRQSTQNILSHAVLNLVDVVSKMDLNHTRPSPPYIPLNDRKEEDEPKPPAAPYLLTGLSIFLSHEPCLMCSMSLLHSRIAHVYYVKRSPGSGGCGSVMDVHEEGGLNHRFEVWEWVGGPKEGEFGDGLDLQMDI